METDITEIAPTIYRLSTFVEPANLVFNQFLIDAEEPLLFHTGMHALFPVVVRAVRSILPVERLRWITFGHVEADECGAMNDWLAAAPDAVVAHGQIGVRTTIADQAIRPPVVLRDNEVLDLGGKRVRRIETPHVPHGWDAGLFYEETTGVLLCGDLFTARGKWPAITKDDIVAPAIVLEDEAGATALTPSVGRTLRVLAELRPTALATMHAPTFIGDASAALRALAASYDERVAAEAKNL